MRKRFYCRFHFQNTVIPPTKLEAGDRSRVPVCDQVVMADRQKPLIFEPRELSVKVRKVSEVGEETLTFENVSYLNGTLGGRIIGWIDFEWTKKSYG